MRPVASSHRARSAAIAQFLGVVACLPALILPDFVPGWAVTASVIGIAAMPIVGYVIARRPFARTPFDLPVGLMLALAPVNLLLSVDRVVTLPHFCKVIAGIALFYGTVGLLLETRWFRLSTWAICVLGLVLLPVLLLGTQWGAAKFSWLPWNIADHIPHTFTPFWKPADYLGFNTNLSGGTLAMLIPVPLAHTLSAHSRHERQDNARRRLIRAALRICTGIESALIAIVLVLTQSRGALLAALVASAVMLTARNWRWLLLVAVVVTGGVWVFQTSGGADTTSDVDSALNSAEGRIELWSRGLAIAQDFPFTGIGMGTVASVTPPFYPTFRIPDDAGIEHFHSLYANTAAETGYAGLITWVAFLCGLLALLWRAGRTSSDSPWGSLVLGSLGTIVVACVHGITDTLFFAPKVFVIAWALFGIGTAASIDRLRAEKA
ncbi:MAG: O-antigen ligase family protein [Anaerolineae bacterium]|nr:O-antigen ligase family protein [Anaerolineae bacterium]